MVHQPRLKRINHIDPLPCNWTYVHHLTPMAEFRPVGVDRCTAKAGARNGSGIASTITYITIYMIRTYNDTAAALVPLLGIVSGATLAYKTKSTQESTAASYRSQVLPLDAQGRGVRVDVDLIRRSRTCRCSGSRSRTHGQRLVVVIVKCSTCSTSEVSTRTGIERRTKAARPRRHGGRRRQRRAQERGRRLQQNRSVHPPFSSLLYIVLWGAARRVLAAPNWAWPARSWTPTPGRPPFFCLLGISPTISHLH